MSAAEAAYAFASQQTWAHEPKALETALHALTQPELLAGLRAATAQRAPRNAAAGVGMLAVHGPITYTPSIWSELFGGTSIQALSRDLRSHVEDPAVSAIVLHVDSPGGTVGGLVEFCTELRAARARKPIVGIVELHAYSAAYWLLAQCDEIVVMPSSSVGSIGVYVLHTDYSKMNDRIGVVPTYVHSGRFKVEGHADAPLEDEAREELQVTVDHWHAAFISDLVRGRQRGLTAAGIRSGFGEGRIVDSQDALTRRMADHLVRTPAEGFGHVRSVVLQSDRRLVAEVEIALLGGRVTPPVVAQDDGDEAEQAQRQADVDAINIALALTEP